MGLLNFIDTGFIIILAILLLISGGIMFYCYRRLNLLEESIINQGKILQNLIINLQNNNINSNPVNENLYKSEYSNQQSKENNIKDDNLQEENGKIEVSDDDSYSEYSDESEAIVETNDSNIKSIKLNNTVDSEKSLSVDENDDDISDNDDILGDNLEQSLINISMSIENESPDETTILEISNDLNLEDTLDKYKSIENINDEKKFDNKIKGLNKMKLDDLKQLIFEKQINLDEDINTLKKADLIKILSN
tara:strand:- start:64 stop:813 length:750 start_codon:yes stop_codon:yes gene_type:complete